MAERVQAYKVVCYKERIFSPREERKMLKACERREEKSKGLRGKERKEKRRTKIVSYKEGKVYKEGKRIEREVNRGWTFLEKESWKQRGS